jgi:serine/threonine-protein phosphatase 2A activator
MQGDKTNTPLPSRTLEPLDRSAGHTFKAPVKCINDGDHVSFFLSSKAYADIMTFIFQLNIAMLPRRTEKDGPGVPGVKEWTLQDSQVSFPPVVQNLAKLLEALTSIIDEAPPDPGPRRFGNVSFRKWSDLVGERVSDLLDQYLPAEVFESCNGSSSEDVTAKHEVETYLVGSFGSSQRLDYGSGHELSFLAFLGCLWKLGAFPLGTDGATERAIVLGVFEP